MRYRDLCSRQQRQSDRNPSTPGLGLNKWGYIVADEKTQATSVEGVFAGGDIVTGGATVILAMGAGRRAARAIGAYLKSNKQNSRCGPSTTKFFVRLAKIGWS